MTPSAASVSRRDCDDSQTGLSLGLLGGFSARNSRICESQEKSSDGVMLTRV